MAEAAISALAGLFGVGIGACVTIWIERARSAALASEAHRNDTRKAQIAARLVLADSRQVRSRLRLAIRNNKTWSPRFALPQEGWQEHRETLALHLSLDDWEVLARFWQTVHRLEAQAEGARLSGGEDRPTLTPFRVEQIRDRGIPRADDALQVLGSFAYGGVYAQEIELQSSEADEADEPV